MNLSAVYQSRVEVDDSLDDYPTPSWATRALCEALAKRGHTLSAMTAREPAANRGHMVRPLAEAFRAVDASDVADYGAGYPVRDYLAGPLPDPVEWTVTNPPFRLAQDFILRALATSTEGVGMFVRTAFLEGIGRHAALFQPRPPTLMLQFSERVNLFRGTLDRYGSKPVSYCWLVWEARWTGTALHWIAPCRKRLERDEDYA